MMQNDFHVSQGVGWAINQTACLSSRKDFEVGNPEVSVLNAASMFRFQTDSPASDSHATEIHWNNKKGNLRESTICSPIKYGWFLSTSTWNQRNEQSLWKRFLTWDSWISDGYLFTKRMAQWIYWMVSKSQTSFSHGRTKSRPPTIWLKVLSAEWPWTIWRCWDGYRWRLYPKSMEDAENVSLRHPETDETNIKNRSDNSMM